MPKNLDREELTEIASVTQKLMTADAQNSHLKNKAFVPNVVRDKNVVSPKLWKNLPQAEKIQCIIVNLHAEIICSCPIRGPKAQDKANLHKMMSMKKHQNMEKAKKSMGATTWNNSMTSANNAGSSAFNILSSNKVPTDAEKERVSRLVFAFQHYALNSKAKANQTNLRYPDLNAQGSDYVERNGVLDAPTRQMLEYLWSNNFQRVSADAAPLCLMGQLFAAELLANVSWPSLATIMFSGRQPQPLTKQDQFKVIIGKFASLDDLETRLFNGGYVRGADTEKSPLTTFNIRPKHNHTSRCKRTCAKITTRKSATSPTTSTTSTTKTSTTSTKTI